MSTFRVDVVRVRLEPHPNADSLSIIRPFGYQVIVRTAEWTDGQLAAYIPPDSVVPDAPEYAFLANKDGELRDKDRRIKVRRFRGIYSQGLLMPAPEGAREGDDVAALMGVTHYEPPLTGLGTGGDAESPPLGVRPVYDVEHYKRHHTLVRPGEPVIITEKIHGTNARFAYADGRLWAGSRSQWKRESDTSLWWRVLRANEGIQRLLRENPDLTLYGEIYGDVQDLKYGHKAGEYSFTAFDLWRGPRYGAGPIRRLVDRVFRRLSYVPIEKDTGWVPAMQAYELCKDYGVAWVPVLYTGPFDAEAAAGMAEGPTVLRGTNVREGCVVRPLTERNDYAIGRVHLKIINDAYLERA